MIDLTPPSCPENLTPPSPPLTGGELKSSSPVKGRRGRGLPLAPVERATGVLPYKKNLTALARENRKNPTPAESKIWNEVLRMRQFADYKFLRQKPIDNYIVDFYCSELRLVIEIDGDSHAESVEYDVERTRVLQSLGLTVVRFTNAEVFQNIEGVYDNLIEKIEKLTPLAPLDRGGLKASLAPALDSPPLSRGGREGLGRAGEGLVRLVLEGNADD